MKKKKVVIFTIISVVALVIITLGVTYAFFNYLRQGTTENTISSGSINFIYDEVDKKGNGINLVDALPISDTEGKSQTNGFNFKIVSKASDTISIPYEITLRKKLGSDNIDNIVKVYLAKTVDNNTTVANEEEVVTSLYSNLTDTTHNGYSEKVLYTSVVPASNNQYNQGYRLKLWIDENTDYSPVNGEYPYNNKTFTVMVNVYSNGKTLTEVSKRANISTVALGNTPITAQQDGSYVTTLPEGTTETTINVETENPYSTVTITKTDSTYTNPIAVSKKVSLSDGNNYFKITVKSEDGKVTNETHLNIYVGKLNFAMTILDNITVSSSSPEIAIRTYDNRSTYSASYINNGLYLSSLTNNNNPTYYFRGNVTNNYVSFAGKLWRIVRINEDGTVRLILNNSIDENGYSYGNINYNNSNIKSVLSTWYTNNLISYDAKIANGNYYCSDTIIYADRYNGTTDAFNFNFSCTTPINDKIGLISYSEQRAAGTGYSCYNDATYLKASYEYWTMTPAGNGDNIWYIGPYCYVNYYDWYREIANYSIRIRPVINLKANVTATGTGTELDPYVIQ